LRIYAELHIAVQIRENRRVPAGNEKQNIKNSVL
jgi:hypothetical protein